MDYDLVFKIITLLLGVVGAAKIFYEYSMGRRSRMREEYKFARDFLSEVKANKDLHPFLKDKGYQAIAGDDQLSGVEIEYLLSLASPEKALRDYVLGRLYLDHLPHSGNLQIQFKRKFRIKWSRRWRMYTYIILYVIFAFIAFSPLAFFGYLGMSLGDSLIAFLISLAVFGSYAWYALQAGAKIYRAEKLVAHQDKHTQKIFLPELIRKD